MIPSKNDLYDLAVIGGGIAGAGIARDAALRGMRVILFEKNTFGSGTSSKSSKLIHGGIRYLETAWHHLKKLQFREFSKNFLFVLHSLKESYTLEKIAPDLVRPIPLVIPVYRGKGRNFPEIILGAFFYGVLTLLGRGKKFPRVLWNAKAVLKLIPSLRKVSLQGGVIIWDHVTDDQRLVTETLASARNAGAKAFEHSEVKAYRKDPSTGLFTIHVDQNGQPVNLLSRKLINAAGPWVDQVRSLGNERTEDYILPVAGSHIMMKPFIEPSVILQATDNRIFFVIQWEGQSRIGTTEWIHRDPDHIEPRKEDDRYLLESLRFYFPDLSFRENQIVSRDCGIRPLARTENAQSPTDVSREHAARIGPSGAIHVLGVKLTDYRRAAEEIVDIIAEDLHKENPNIRKRSQTAFNPLRQL